MRRWNIIVTTGDADAERGRDLAHRLLEAWTDPQPATFGYFSLGDLAVRTLREVDAVVVLAGGLPRGDEVRFLLDAIERSHLPAIALRDASPRPDDPFLFAGAVCERERTAPEALCAAVKALVHRQAEIDRLHKQMSLAERFHGSLQGEITRFHEELQLAAMVQREFLPRELPTLHGVSVCALWRPTNYVSGDIYDIVRLDEDHLGVMLADAVGHGVPAALLTMVISRSIRTKEVVGSRYRILEPSEVLENLNRDMIRRQGRTTRFATAVYAIINCRERVMRLAGAGHPPPMLIGADGSNERIETPGGLLGVFDDETYGQVEIELKADDQLLLFSDGFEQAFRHELKDPTAPRSDRYLEVFAELAATPDPQAKITTLEARLDEASGSLHQEDDLTLIALHATALGSPDASAVAIDDAVGSRTADTAII